MQIQIKECDEPLVDIKKACPGVLIALDPNRMKKEKTAYLRKTVAKKICQAKKNLPKGMTFIIRDAWRPQYVQKEIFEQFIKMFKKKYPSWPMAKIIKEAKKYVAPAQGINASGHMTGGAVDLRLIKNGRKVPMRSSKLTYQENAKPIQPKLPEYIQKNRKIMFEALEKAGFSCNPNEFWHWSYGDVHWAKRNKRKIVVYDVVRN